MLFIPKEDKLRHELLRLLFEKVATPANDGQHFLKETELKIPIITIAQILKVSPKTIRDITTVMIPEKEVEFIFDQVEYLMPCDKTALAFCSKKYLIQGRDFVRANLDFYFKWAIPVALLLSIYNTIGGCGEKANRQEIQSLKQRLNELENKKIGQYLSLKYPILLAVKK